jgi:plastocyanin
MTKPKLVALIAVLALSLTACGNNEAGGDGGDGGGGRAVTVTASNFSFDPTSIDAEAGEELEITLANDDSVGHSITIEDPSFEIEADAGAQTSGSFTVPESGGVEFFCKFHPDQMTGTIGAMDAGGGGMDTSPEDDKKKDDSNKGDIEY